MRNNFFIAVCMTISISLFFAWSQRWAEGPNQTTVDQDTNIVLQHKKDNWANQSWTVIYGVDGKTNYYGVENPALEGGKDAIEIEEIRDRLTYAWFGVTLLFLFLSLFGLLKKFTQRDVLPERKNNLMKKPSLESRL